MENISALQNSYNNQLTPDVQNKINNQENFTALDKEKIKKDSVEIANKAKENANENILFRTMRNLGVEDPKKTLKSVLFSVITVIGVAILGNKLSTPAAKLGNSIDDILTGDNIIGKCRNGITGLLSSGFEKLKKLPKPKFVTNIKEALKTPLKPVWNVFRGFENGAKGIFANTIEEIFSTATDKNRKEMAETLANTLGGDKAKAHRILNEIPEVDLSRRMRKFFSKNTLSDDVLQKMSDNQIFGRGLRGDKTSKAIEAIKELSKKDVTDAQLRSLSGKLSVSSEFLDELTRNNTLGDDTESVVRFLKKLNKQLLKNASCKENFNKVQFADKLLKEIGEVNGCGKDTKKLTEVLIKLSEGGFGNGLKNVEMNQGGFISAWWPANIVNKAIHKITGKEVSALQGNMGDSLIKYGAVRGKLAKTLPAKFVQIVPPLAGDQVSNFVNDKSGMGVLLCANLIGNFNKLQDAPKEKKVTTAVNDVASGSLNWMVGMPITYAALYSLASLSKTQGKDIVSTLVRNFGKIFAVGLNNAGKTGFLSKAAGTAGGIGRFAFAFFVILPFVGRKIDSLCAKIFGKPYDPSEAAKEKQLEEAKKQVIPELGITQGELLEKMEKNPEVMAKIQKDPELLAKVQNDPKALLDLLDGKDNKIQETSKNPFGQTISPATKSILENRNKTNAMPTNSTNKLIVGSDTNKIGGKKSNTKNDKTTDNNTVQIDNLTYIPSSDGMVKSDSILSPEQLSEYNKQMEDADKILKRAEKYI